MFLRWIEDVLGSSHPWRVEDVDAVDTDGNESIYLAKHFRSGDAEQRVSEYIGASLAHQLGVGAPEPAILTFTPDFLQALHRQVPQPRNLATAVAGEHVAVRWVEGAALLLERSDCIRALERPGQVGEIVGCDTWLVNLDRTDGNVLVTPGAQFARGRHVLHPVDWEMSLAGHSAIAGLANLYGHPKVWNNCPVLLAAVKSKDDFAAFRAKLDGWAGSTARARMLVNGLPRSWNVSDADREALVTFLARRADTALERFSRSDDPDGMFGNWQYGLAV